MILSSNNLFILVKFKSITQKLVVSFVINSVGGRESTRRVMFANLHLMTVIPPVDSLEMCASTRNMVSCKLPIPT